MLLDLSKLLRDPGALERFDLTLDFSDMVFGGNAPAQEPVRASGTVRNTAGVLMLDGVLATTLHGVCDRCAETFLRETEIPVHAILESDPDSAESDDIWTFRLTDGKADMDDILRTAFVLNMDAKQLCREDCKGLCCRCGANLNRGPCGCKPETDPRLAVLKKLLK